MKDRLLKSIEIKGPSGPRALHFRPGTSDEGAIRQIFEQQEYSIRRLKRAAEILAFVEARHKLGHIPVIVDAGANIGASSVYFAFAFPSARIVAIEPEYGNFTLLERNTAGLNVRCLRAGLSSAAGKLKVVDPGEGHWGYRTETGGGSGQSVSAVTVPQIYAEECGAGAFPFIAKIDIEGAEGDVFSRDTGWFARTPVVILEPHDWLIPKGGTSRGFLECLAGQPRDFLIVGENIYSIAHALG